MWIRIAKWNHNTNPLPTKRHQLRFLLILMLHVQVSANHAQQNHSLFLHYWRGNQVTSSTPSISCLVRFIKVILVLSDCVMPFELESLHTSNDDLVLLKYVHIFWKFLLVYVDFRLLNLLIGSTQKGIHSLGIWVLCGCF